jgi:hypothetical protein
MPRKGIARQLQCGHSLAHVVLPAVSVLYTSYRYGWDRAPERLQMAVTWRLPRWVVYWSVVRAGAHATTGKLGYHQHMPSLLLVDALKSWTDNRGGDRWAERYNRRETRKLRRLIERWTGHR